MKFIGKISALACAFVLASCGSVDGKSDGGGKRVSSLPPAPAMDSAPDYPVKIGEPYTVGGKTYTPQDVAAYDEVGYASWYGEELEGRPTANGEVFVASGVSAAHKTLPMPSYVEITALDTGKTIIARVNDRGPFAHDRLIDLSAGAARELGVTGQGVSGVRVRKVNPPEQDKSVLRSGRAAPARIDTPESLLKILRQKLAQMPRPAAAVQQAAVVAQPRVAAPQASAVQPSSARPGPGDGRFVREGAGAVAPTADNRPPAQATGDGRFVRQSAGAPAPRAAGLAYVVQIAAYSSRARADDLAKRAGARVFHGADGIFRVHFGPYATEADAQKALVGAQARGHSSARIFTQ